MLQLHINVFFFVKTSPIFCFQFKVCPEDCLFILETEYVPILIISGVHCFHFRTLCPGTSSFPSKMDALSESVMAKTALNEVTSSDGMYMAGCESCGTKVLAYPVCM